MYQKKRSSYEVTLKHYGHCARCHNDHNPIFSQLFLFLDYHTSTTRLLFLQWQALYTSELHR